ncbi:pentatricopeptide repeat (PPR) superfamily protein [Actinidia rufa]|uniref:Pentatricopeptide repeat (PPR) superfamily protein n=1 Tax=Actinidia rufa TaxID=165716 RepID=A0A7J0GMU7_9ERIC|nr:pentatricopeptide repeat (PPR) superfamily protein [Actinidia rufa]
MPPNPLSTDLKKLCGVVSSSIGGLDELEASISKFNIPLTPSLVTQVIDACKNEASTRRLLRRTSGDIHTLISHLDKEGRKMETWTVSVVAEALVKLGREEEALGIFKNLVKFKSPQDRFAVTECKGSTKNYTTDEGSWHYVRPVVLQYIPRGQNLKSNPSGLIPEALNVMMEMRTRRVKESLRILDIMRSSGCSPDWVSYYLVARVLFLTLRFGKGKQIVEKMMEDGLVPARKFYYDLIGILRGVEKVNYALDLFEKMKKSLLGSYGPVYDLLIQKLCRGGEFEKGSELWDEATKIGITPVFKRCVGPINDRGEHDVYEESAFALLHPPVIQLSDGNRCVAEFELPCYASVKAP